MSYSGSGFRNKIHCCSNSKQQRNRPILKNDADEKHLSDCCFGKRGAFFAMTNEVKVSVYPAKSSNRFPVSLNDS